MSLNNYQTNNSDDEFSQLKIGDIIWAKRYTSEEKRHLIKEGHREGPYIIIAKNNNSTYGLFCTSNAHEECQSPYIYYKANFINDGLNKTSYIKTTQLHKISQYQYQQVIGTLNDQELNKLFKVLHIVNNDKQNSLNKIMPNIPFTIDVGDIISVNAIRYYIHAKDSTHYYCYLISHSQKNNANLIIHNQCWVVDFLKTEKFSTDDKQLKLVDIIDNTQIKNIATIKSQYEEEKAHINTICRGKLVTVDGNLYYIYSEYQDNWLCFKVSITYTGKKYYIIIGGKQYHTNYEKQIIPKKIPMQITSIANSREIETIKVQRDAVNLKNKKAQRIKDKITTSYQRFIPKVIIFDKYTLEQYLIIRRHQETLTLLNLSTNEFQEYFLTDHGENPFVYYRKVNNVEYHAYLINKPKPKTLKRKQKN